MFFKGNVGEHVFTTIKKPFTRTKRVLIGVFDENGLMEVTEKEFIKRMKRKYEVAKVEEEAYDEAFDKLDDAIDKLDKINETIDEVEKEESTEEINVDGLSWNELRSYASELNVYKPGMKKDEVLTAIKAEL